jgi:hypothetical protein
LVADPQVGGLTLPKSRGKTERGKWRLGQVLREFLHGMGGYEFVRHAMEERASMEALFMAITVGDMVGLPILPPYYSLRLLPYVTPSIESWKRRVLRERDLADHESADLHGV